MTKRDIINLAFGSIGLQPYSFSLPAEAFQEATHLLDGMVASWNAEGVRIGYVLSSVENSQIDDQIAIPDTAFQALWSNLGVLLTTFYGRVLDPRLALTAQKSYTALINHVSRVGVMTFPDTLPLGQGNRRFYDGVNFFSRSEEIIESTAEGQPIHLE